MPLHYILIPIVTVLAAAIGGRFTAASVTTWYVGLKKPSWTPPGRVIGMVWTVLYILACASALIAWDLPLPVIVYLLFGLNAVLNVGWSWMFFYLRRMFTAIGVCLLLDLTIVLLIWLVWPSSLTASVLLVPYAAWVAFASYLNYRVWAMNR